MDQISECLHRPDQPWHATVAVDLKCVNFANCFQGSLAELTEQLSVVPEEYAEPLGYREYPLTVRDWRKDLIPQTVAEQQRPLLVARRAA